jgi:hypothetical protein
MSAEEVNELYNTIVKEKVELENFIDFDFHPEYDYNQLNDEITEKIEDLSIRAEIPIEEINERLKVDVEELFKKRILTTDEVRFELVNTSNLKQEKTMSEQQNTSVKEVKDYQKQWQEYEYDTTQPLTTKDIYAFFGKGGTAEFISEKLSELSGQQVSIPKFIKNIDLWNNIVKPFRELPQEKQTELKESLISFVAQKQQEVQNKTPEQKSQEMYNFYHQYEIRPNTKLTKHDLYAFMLQYGAQGKNKILEVAGKALGREVQSFEGVKGVDFENFVVKPLLEKGEESSKMFKQELVDILPTQKAIQEEKAVMQQEEPWALRHLKSIDVTTGLTDKNIFALSQLQGGENFQEAREQLFESYLGMSYEEVKALDKTQMIEKVKEIKYGQAAENGTLEHQFKSDIQKVYLVSEAEKNLQNTDLYAQQLAALEYPTEEGKWTIQHVDKLMSENNILDIMHQMNDLDFVNRYGNALGSLYSDVEIENIIYTQTFHGDVEFIEAKQDLLNALNHSTPDFKEELLATLENKNDNAIRMSR